MRIFIQVANFVLAMSILTVSCSGEEKRNAGYSGQDISADFCIKRNKYDKKASLISQTTEPWTLYAGRSVDAIEFDKPLASGSGFGKTTLNLPDSVRYYFEVETDRGTAIFAERLLPIQGAFNVRDMGGIRSGDGRWVKWGVMFRADELNNLTTSDMRYLAAIPIRTLVDFRSREEMCQNPDNVPASVEQVEALTISPGNLMDLATSTSPENITSGMVDNLMKTLNEQLVTDSMAIVRYRKFFELVQNEENLPLLFHCTAGKDRTGMAAALFLYSVGVDARTVMNDYLDSNENLEGKFAAYKTRYPELEGLFGVKETFLQAGLDTIDEKYGSVEKYLTDILGVDLDRMRDIYLY